MFRNFDWSCCACGNTKLDHMIEIPQGARFPVSLHLHCEVENRVRCHRRLPPRTAHYMPKPINALVAGGSLDTAGFKKLTPLPEFPKEAETSLEAAREHFATKEYKEIKEKRKHEKYQNKLKKWRSGLIKKGYNIDLRQDKLPGDPKRLV